MNTRSINWGLLASILILSGAAARVAAAEAEQAVIAAENQVTKAVQMNSVEAYGALLADKYVSTDEEGTVLVGKAANLADFKLGTVTSFEQTDIKVTMFGNAAVAIGTFATKGTYKGKPVDHRGRFTDTWIMTNGKWLCAATHVSLIKKD